MDHDEFVIGLRGFSEMTDDKELYHFAEVVTGNWFQNGACRSFEDYRLNESMQEHPYHDLTLNEYARLRLMQRDAQDQREASVEDEAWQLIKTLDCSIYVKELWRNKYGDEQILTKFKS